MLVQTQESKLPAYPQRVWRGTMRQAGLGWIWRWEVQHGVLYVVWDTVIKADEQTLPNVWLKMERYLQFLNIYSICFGCNLLRLLKVKPKDAIRISCRWSSIIFCKMKSVSSTWNHTPQPVHCMNRSCNRNYYQNNTQNHNQHQFPSLICTGWIHAE